EDGAAEGRAELVALQVVLSRPPFVGEEVGGVEDGVAQVFERRAVELIGSALGHDVDLPAGTATEFGLRDGCLYSELLHGVGDWEVAERGIDLGVRIADAVNQEDVRLRTRSGDVESAPLRARRRGQYAGCEQSQIEKLARVERHIRNRPAINDTTQRIFVGFENRG